MSFLSKPVTALLLLGLTAAPAAAAMAKPSAKAPPSAPAAATPAKPPPAAPAGPAAAAAPAGAPISIETQARHAIVMDAETGAVLLDKGADERMPPASMAKMMTAYMVFSYLKDGRAKLTDTLPISSNAWRTGGSKMFVPVGAHVAIEDLIRGMIIDSGNDACVALAEGLAGSVDAFVAQMNRKAKEIGLTNSNFTDVDGLPDPNEYSTAHDLAIIALRTIKDFPQYYKYYSEVNFRFSNITQGNRNPLLYKNIGADGLKTGHTEESGYSLTASIVRNGRRVISVLQGLPSSKARDQESERLLDWAFREFDDYKLFAAGAKVDDAEVWLGTAPNVPLTATHDIVVTLPKSSRKDMKVAVDYKGPVPAPVKKGQPIGKLVVTAPNTRPAEVPLVAGADVPRMGPLGRIATLAGWYIWGRGH
jgi:D-alanyl-D-alanine carboxypeptidase (penicillin-binding protein 5/6)